MQKLTKWISVSVALGCACAWAADPPAGTATKMMVAAGEATPDADNTGVNVRDKEDATATPQKQTNRAGDRKLLAAVRRAVVHDKTLSMSAHNIKIIVKHGVVILRGPVDSDDEKEKIETLAQNVAGDATVENHLDVKNK